MSIRPFVLSAVLLAVAACSADGLWLEDATSVGIVDGGRSDRESSFGTDTGAVGEREDSLACRTLIEKTCGARVDGGAPGCEAPGACEAARLLARYESERCTQALSDEVTFPSCGEGACADLVEKVCGAGGPPAVCENAPGCAPARALLERATGGDAAARAEAGEACSRSLQDDVAFRACAL